MTPADHRGWAGSGCWTFLAGSEEARERYGPKLIDPGLLLDEPFLATETRESWSIDVACGVGRNPDVDNARGWLAERYGVPVTEVEYVPPRETSKHKASHDSCLWYGCTCRDPPRDDDVVGRLARMPQALARAVAVALRAGWTLVADGEEIAGFATAYELRFRGTVTDRVIDALAAAGFVFFRAGDDVDARIDLARVERQWEDEREAVLDDQKRRRNAVFFASGEPVALIDNWIDPRHRRARFADPPVYAPDDENEGAP